MAFGQVSGPPATGKQLQELLGLLQEAGHRDFRDARGPMGFTQRQAGGKFTRAEAEEFIDQLRAAADAEAEVAEILGESPLAAPPPSVASPRPAGPRAAAQRAASSPAAAGAASAGTPLSAGEMALRRIPSELLAAELQRRGWVVMEP